MLHVTPKRLKLAWATGRIPPPVRIRGTIRYWSQTELLLYLAEKKSRQDAERPWPRYVGMLYDEQGNRRGRLRRRLRCRVSRCRMYCVFGTELCLSHGGQLAPWRRCVISLWGRKAVERRYGTVHRDHQRLTMSQTASMLYITTQRLKDMVDAGRVPPPIRMRGRRQYWLESEIRAFTPKRNVRYAPGSYDQDGDRVGTVHRDHE